MTNLEQTIIEKVHAFPQSKQQKLLQYAEELENEVSAESPKHQTIWEMVKDIIEEVPKEEWDKLPTDGSINVDHYLYGHKKKTK
jgi:hypothetical protein